MPPSDIYNTFGEEAANGSQGAGWPVLAAGFVLAFSIACALLLVVGHYALNSPRSLSPFSAPAITENATNDPVSDPFLVSAAGMFQKAVVGEKANPLPGQDYTFFVWVKVRRPPVQGEVYSLLGKFDAEVGNRPGYALSLEGAPDGVRPRVYLSAGTERGRWYSFSAYPMSRKRWYALAVTLSQDTFVSAHIVEQGSDQPPVLLGGHRIRLSSLPYSASDLVVGAFGSSRFRGYVGPFGIISGERLQKNIVSYLSDMRLDLNKIPSSLPRSSLRLWATPKRDLGPSTFEVVEGRRDDSQRSVPILKPSKNSVGAQTSTKRVHAAKAVAPAKPAKNTARSRR